MRFLKLYGYYGEFKRPYQFWLWITHFLRTYTEATKHGRFIIKTKEKKMSMILNRSILEILRYLLLTTIDNIDVTNGKRKVQYKWWKKKHYSNLFTVRLWNNGRLDETHCWQLNADILSIYEVPYAICISTVNFLTAYKYIYASRMYDCAMCIFQNYIYTPYRVKKN